MTSEFSEQFKTVSFLNQPLSSVAELSRQQLNKISKALGDMVFNLIIENIPEK